MTQEAHFSHESFKALLATEHTWPCDFSFKFIVETTRVADVAALFPGITPSLRPSKNGNYVCATVIAPMPDPESVVAVYTGASQIEGIISI